MSTGITTWIKDSLLKGIPFNRRGCKGMGSPQSGLLKGRKIDSAFKSLCQTGKVAPGTKTWVVRRIEAIQKSLRKANVKVCNANVFVKMGGLKTHLDGVGIHTPTGEKVVLELKSTQASLANHRAAYDIACSAQPTVALGRQQTSNTERLHHAIQLAFGVYGLKTTRGYVIISASDGAALYAVNRGIPLHLFTSVSVGANVAKTPGKAEAPGKKTISVSKWPGCNVAMQGWTEQRRLRTNIFLVRKNHQVAVAAAAKIKKHVPKIMKILKTIRQKTKTEQALLAVVRPAKRNWICHLHK